MDSTDLQNIFIPENLSYFEIDNPVQSEAPVEQFKQTENGDEIISSSAKTLKERGVLQEQHGQRDSQKDCCWSTNTKENELRMQTAIHEVQKFVYPEVQIPGNAEENFTFAPRVHIKFDGNREVESSGNSLQSHSSRQALLQDESTLQIPLRKDADGGLDRSLSYELKPTQPTFFGGVLKNCYFCQDQHTTQLLPVCRAWQLGAQRYMSDASGDNEKSLHDDNQLQLYECEDDEEKMCVDLASLSQQKKYLQGQVERLQNEVDSLRSQLKEARLELSEKTKRRQSQSDTSKHRPRRNAQVTPYVGRKRSLSDNSKHSFFSTPELATESRNTQPHSRRGDATRTSIMEKFKMKLRAKVEHSRKRRLAKRSWLINPFSIPKVLFDVVMVLLVCYSVIIVPVQLAFGGLENGGFRTFEIALDCVFLLDLCLHFNTAYEERGQMVCDRVLIAKRYLKGLFAVDLLGSFPFFLLAEAFGSSSNLTILKLSRLLRVMRMLRLALLSTILARLSKSLSRLLPKLYDSGFALPFQTDSAWMNLLSRVLKILFLAHIMACTWYSLNSCSHEIDDWVRCGDDTKRGSRYLAALYFTIQTMMTVGYGDVAVNTDAQRAFAMVIQLSGPMIVGIITSSIGELVESLDLRSKHLAERMSSIKQYISQKNLPAHLHKQLYKHFKYFYTNTTVFDEEAIVQSLPASVHQKLLLHQHHLNLENVPFFQYFLNCGHNSFVLDIAHLLKPMFAQIGQDIALQGDPAEEVYFIKKGQVNALLMGSILGPILVGVFREGSMLNLANVICHLDMAYTIRAACSSDILWVHMENLQVVMAKHPETKTLVQLMTDKERQNTQTVLESPTDTVGQFVSKEVVFCEPNDIDKPKLWLAADVQIDMLEDVFSGLNKRTVRTIKLTKGMLKWASGFGVFCGKKLSLENLSKFDETVIEKEETTESLQEKYLIDPGSQWHKNWNLAVLLLTIYRVVCVPVSIGFNVEGETLIILDGLVDFFFLVDIILRFRTLDEAAPLLYFADPMIIALRYLRGWFFFDLLSTLPLDSMLLVSRYRSSKYAVRGVSKMCRFMRFLKLLRLFKIPDLTSHISTELGPYKYILQQLLILFAVLLYVGHFFGCFWGLLAFENIGGLEASWMGPIIAGDTPLAESDITNQYTAAVYWAFTTITTVGFGDIKPTTDNEKLYSVVVMIFGAAMLSFIVDDVSKLVYQLDAMETQNKKAQSEINEYIKEQSLAFNLSNSIKKHVQFAFSTQHSQVERAIIKNLPCELRKDLILHSYQQIIESIPIFHNTSRAFICIILQNMTLEFNEAKTWIYNTQEGSKGLYFLMNGVVEELKKQPQAESEKLFGIVEKGGYFGHRRFVNGTRAKFGARALTDSHTFVLYKKEIVKLQINFPSVSFILKTCLQKKDPLRLKTQDQEGKLDTNRADTKQFKVAPAPTSS